MILMTFWNFDSWNTSGRQIQSSECRFVSLPSWVALYSASYGSSVLYSVVLYRSLRVDRRCLYREWCTRSSRSTAAAGRRSTRSLGVRGVVVVLYYSITVPCIIWIVVLPGWLKWENGAGGTLVGKPVLLFCCIVGLRAPDCHN